MILIRDCRQDFVDEITANVYDTGPHRLSGGEDLVSLASLLVEIKSFIFFTFHPDVYCLSY